MMWNYSFTTKQEGETIEEGFDTCNASEISEVIKHIHNDLDLRYIDEIELKINKLNF